MTHTHEFDCKTCGAHLDSRQELDQHNREHHTKSDVSLPPRSASPGSSSRNPGSHSPS